MFITMIKICLLLSIINALSLRIQLTLLLLFNARCIRSKILFRLVTEQPISINREANQCQYVSLGVQLEGRTCIQLEKYYNKCVQLGMMS